jgi:hypothetical protein
MLRTLWLIPTLLAASVTANAADNGFYLGGSIGQANVEIDRNLARIDDDDTGYKFIVGLRPLDWLGVEASYVDFGKVTDNNLRAEANGFTAFVVGFLPVGPVDLFAKAGVINSDTSVVLNGGGEVFDRDGNDLAYGVGAQFRLLSLGVRAEYERFDVDDVENLNMFSIGVTYTFL